MDNKIRQQTEPKQVIIVRKDLKMPAGKLGAQTAHASLGALFKCGLKNDEMLHIDLRSGDAVERWLNGRFTKIVLAVKNEEALKKVYQNAVDAGLPAALIQDAGFTVFGEPTYTCAGIGPAYPEDFVGVTDKLQVYK